MHRLGIVFLVFLVSCGAARSTPPTPVAMPIPTETTQPTDMPTETAITPSVIPTFIPTVEATPAPKPTDVPAATADPNSDPAGVLPATKDDCPDAYPVKGNIRSDGRKLYHLPGWSSYKQTDPERCFANAADAQKAGFDPAR